MKFFLGLLFVVGAVLSNSTHYYGWQPQKELVFRFESTAQLRIPQISSNHAAGLRLKSLVRIQTQLDYSLVLAIEQPRFITINGETVEESREEPIPEPFKSSLLKPFKVHLRRGVVEALFVDKNEPLEIINIKKAIVANLNMDLSASRRAEVESNRLEIPAEQDLEQAPVDQSYFTVREQSLLGDCQTSYSIHELPKYESMEIEQQILEDEQKRNSKEHLIGGLSLAKEVCRGKKYWQVSKTINLDNCIGRPVYQRWTGVKAKCDVSKAACKDLSTQTASTNYIVCGNDIRDFTIRKSVTEHIMLNGIAWKTQEMIQKTGKIILELIKEESISTPITPPSNELKITSLVFQYEVELSEQEKNKIEQESGIRPVLPMPDLKSAPKMMVSVKLTKTEIIRQVEEQMEKISREMFESPESCTSKCGCGCLFSEKGDVAGHLNVITKALRTLSYDDLKEVESKIMSRVNSHQQVQLRSTLKHLFYDTLSMVATNPAVMLVTERVKEFSSSGDRYLSLKMVQNTMTNLRTPTPELLRELVRLIKTDLKQWSHQEPMLFNVAMLQMSRLIHRACVSPLSQNQFPVKVYGPFCNKNSQIVEEYITFLEQELEHQPQRTKLNILAALGKLGHIRSVKVLSKVISKKEYSPMVRSLAVYSLKKAAMLEPVHVRPILLTIIDNIAEASEVRIAAVAVLPWSQPTTAELQKIATRTWFEPSKQVASFIFSTFKSLVSTEIPELKILSQKVKPLMTLVKPFELGYQYSKNINSAEFVKYLDMIVSQKWSWTMSRQEPIVPVRVSLISKLFSSSFDINGPKFTVYTQGMDKLVDLILFYTRQQSPASQVVEQQLTKITELLKIKDRRSVQTPEIFGQLSVLDLELEYYVDKVKVEEIFEELKQLVEDQRTLELKREFVNTRASRIVETEMLSPSASGFAIYDERSLPVVFAIKGSAEITTEKMNDIYIPRILKGKLIPVVNMKLEVNTGVVSPFNQQLIGTGLEMSAHATIPLEMTLSRKLAQIVLDIKVPEQLTKAIELVHVFVTPFTVRKDLTKIQPVSKSTDLKIIYSGKPLKETNMKIGKALELDATLVGKTDAEFTDIFSYWQKIRQQSPVSLVHTFWMPSSVRMSSGKILFNPQTSKTKEISFALSLVHSNKINNLNAREINMPFSGKQLSNTELIHEVCIENFPSQPIKYDECIVSLTAIEVVDEKVNSICKTQTHNSYFKNCQLLEKVCDKARSICETKNGYVSKDCTSLSESCYRKLFSVQQLHKTISEFGASKSEASVASIRMDASIKSQYGSKGVSIGASGAIKKTELSSGKQEISMVSNIEVKAVTSPIYEVKLVSKVEVPRVNNRWNTERLIEEAIQLVLNGQIQFGFETEQKQIIELKSTILKSQEQMRSVKLSPEYLRCKEQELEGKVLSNVCEYTRHQAASVDKLEAEIKFPTFFTRSPIFYKAGDLIRSIFLGQMWHEESTYVSQNSLKLVAKVKRTGEEAQLIAEYAGQKYKIVDVRIPSLLRPIFPISMRNPVTYTAVQKLTRGQIPASCRIEPTYIATFDNKTYSYEMNDCYHLVFRDCSEVLPVAVMAKTLSSNLKEVKILAGQVSMVMSPKSKTEVELKMNLEGQVKNIIVNAGQIKEIKNSEQLTILEIRRYQDNVYTVYLPKEGLLVLFDGERVEISASQLLKSRACGLCGDLDHENTADLKSPEMCVMRPRFTAYSYMIQEQCQGIPSQEKTKYEKELSQCVKSKIIPTDLKPLSKIVTQMVKPIISQHVVKKQTGKTCLSVQRIKVCSKISKEEVHEPKPIKVQRKLIQYVCVDAPSVEAQSLEQRAKAGEQLEMRSLGKPVAFSKIEYEPVLCERQSNEL